MLQGNQMAYALKEAGLINEIPVCKPRRKKQFKCHKCGTVMLRPDNTNVMVCPKCREKGNGVNYFLFTDN